MSALVVNRIKLRFPFQDLFPDFARELPSAVRGLPGFERFTLAKIGPTEMVVVISWSSVETAARAAAILGPGLFNTYVAPHAKSQDRVAGEVLLEVA